MMKMVPGVEGRTLQIRPTLGGDGVQLGIIGKRGGLIEAFCVEHAQIPAFVFALDSVSEEAWADLQAAPPRERLPFEVAEPHERDLLGLLAQAEAERNATHCPEGHELTAENSYQRRPGVKGCRRCRRERNFWTGRRREGALR
jgi:hypothetical protein